MPPLNLDQLLVGEQYYLRDKDTFLPPEPYRLGSGSLTLDNVDENNYFSFHVTEKPSFKLSFEREDNIWFFFPVADGEPVPPAPAEQEYGGYLVVPDDAKNIVSMESIAEGDELVNWNIQNDPQGRRESNFGYYYTKDTYNRLPDPKTSPITRGLITNPKLYTALMPASPNSSLFERTRSKRTRSKRKGKSRKNKLRKRSIYN